MTASLYLPRDVEFLRWIVGFGGNVKVTQPEALMVKVKAIGDAIVRVYE
ncbi:WYL domain-containing protein [Nostoc sp. 'Peltigera membranacea cyanobiont' 232]|nr:WYL domain-containing protein [Nostoc sp. 'Peltigera membranacea cyanobiont' 232]